MSPEEFRRLLARHEVAIGNQSSDGATVLQDLDGATVLDLAKKFAEFSRHQSSAGF